MIQINQLLKAKDQGPKSIDSVGKSSPMLYYLVQCSSPRILRLPNEVNLSPNGLGCNKGTR